MAMLISSHRHDDLFDHFVEAMQHALGQHNNMERHQRHLPLGAGVKSLFFDQPLDPAMPDAAIVVPDEAPEPLHQIVERAETDRKLNTYAARDRERMERLGALPESSHRCQVVIEAHAGRKQIGEAESG